jgi:protein TonB
MAMTRPFTAESEPGRRGGRRFTLIHGLSASLALHGALGLPLVVNLWPNEEDASSLVFEMDGALSDAQSDESTEQDVQGAAPSDSPAAQAAADETEPKPETDVQPDGEIAQNARREVAAATDPKQASAGRENATGAEQRKAQTIDRTKRAEDDLVIAYVKQLSKRIQSRLVYPREARAAGLEGAATVSFTIAASGQMVASTARVLVSSGKPTLDASALATVRAASPFAAPPREMSVAVAVVFSRRR